MYKDKRKREIKQSDTNTAYFFTVLENPNISKHKVGLSSQGLGYHGTTV